MSAGHRHTPLPPAGERGTGPVGTTGPTPPLSLRRGACLLLWILVIGIVAGTAAGVWELWPRSAAAAATLPTGSVEVDPYAAVVVSFTRMACPGSALADGGPSAAAASSAGSSAPIGGTVTPTMGTDTPAGKAIAAADKALAAAIDLYGGDDVAATGPATGPAPDAGPAVKRSGPATPATRSTNSTPGAVRSAAPDATPVGDDTGLVTDTSCSVVQVRLRAGPDTGKVEAVQLSSTVADGGLAPGDKVTVARFPAVNGAAATYGWVDYSRGQPLSLLALGFVGVVLLVARWRGITALAGLALGYVTIVEFTLPALRAGHNALGVGLAGSVAIMVVILYVAHGPSAKTTTALLGTVFGLTVAACLAWWAASAAHLDGLGSEDNLSLTALPGDGLRGVILCGILLASLGVLNDVTVTQASAVWELAEHAPHLDVRGLFRSGMRIGRDHLASTVYTIAFAYAGAALPTLMLIEMFRTSWLQAATSGQIAEEIVRTLVGAIGLILAIPITTLIAALLVVRGRRQHLPTAATSSLAGTVGLIEHDLLAGASPIP